MFSREKLSEKSDSRVKQIISRAPWEKKSILCYITNKKWKKSKTNEKYTTRYPFLWHFKGQKQVFQTNLPQWNVFLAPYPVIYAQITKCQNVSTFFHFWFYQQGAPKPLMCFAKIALAPKLERIQQICHLCPAQGRQLVPPMSLDEEMFELR